MSLPVEELKPADSDLVTELVHTLTTEAAAVDGFETLIWRDARIQRTES
jgi:hypothetical protein